MKMSVVIPVYNEQKHLTSCLTALLNQTRAFDEIIVVDNNSTDETAKIAHSFGVIVIKEKQQGILAAVYRGIDISSGDIIARCDADSIVPSNWAELIEKKLFEKPNAAGVTGPGIFYDTGKLRAYFAQIWYMYPYFFCVGSALANWPIFGSNCAIRRSVWYELKGNLHRNRIDTHDDMEISIHIPPTHPIIFMPSLTVYISARSLRSRDLKLRYMRGITTLRIHRSTDSPLRRWRSRLYLNGII